MHPPQNTFVDKVDRFFLKLAGWAVNHRAIVVGFCLLLLCGGLYFASRVQSDNSLQAYFDKQDPTYIAYFEYLEEFSSDEIAYLLYRVPNSEHGVFDYAAMQKVAQLTQALEDEVPFVREVTSLTNVEFMRADGDSIYIDELMLDFPKSQADLLKFRELVVAHPLYVNYLINQDASYSAIILEMEKSSVDALDDIIYDPAKGDALQNIYPQVSDNKIREILARPEYQGVEFIITGDVPMNAAYNNAFMADAGIGTGITFAVLALMSLLLLRVSLVGLLGPLVVVLLSMILVLGLMGMMGWALGTFFGIVPTLLCAVGVAQSVHIVLEYQRSLESQANRKQAVQDAIGKVGGVCLMAALTTAFGLLVMTVSHLKVLGEMAMYAAAGVMFTFLLSVTLLVVFLAGGRERDDPLSAKQIERSRDIPPRKDKPLNHLISRWVAGCITLNLSYPKQLVMLGAAVIAVSLLGVSMLRVDFNFLEEFKPHVEWRKHTELAEQVMGGILSVSYIVDTGRENGVKDPAVLKAIDQMQQFAKQQPFVKNAYSIADIQKDINRSFHGDDMAWYTIADNRELIAQYFLMYEVSGGEELANFVSTDFSRTVVELRVEITASSNVKALMLTIENYLSENPIPNAEVRRTGMGLLWVTIAEYIADTQFFGYSLIFIGISLFLCLIFGSVKVGLLTMIPNVVPVLVVLGFMGWTNMPLDYIKLLLATIAIGIAVDDSMHLVTRFRRRFFECGNYAKALEQSLVDVGPALIITTIILLAAFSCYLFSSLQVIASFGMLLSMAIFVALIADLLFMPALLMLAKPFGKEFSVKENSAIGE